MASLAHNSRVFDAENTCDKVAPKADSRQPNNPVEEWERMARRRFQDPEPKLRGEWWVIQVRRDDFVEGQRKRTKTRVRIAPANKPVQEVRKIAAEYLRPMNQGLESIGSATNFAHYVEKTYIPVVMPLV